MSWPIAKLSELCDVQSGGTPSRTKADYWDGDIPWVTITDMRKGLIDSTGECISQAGLENSAAKVFPTGTLLLSIFATIGRTAILNIPAATNQAIAGITVKRKELLEVGYLKNYLDFFARELASRGRGVAQNNINLSILKNSPIPLPPLPEQRRIASILDKADALRAKRREAIAKLDQLLQSVFLEMFGDPMSNPRRWTVKPLADLCKNKPTYGSGAASKLHDGLAPRYVRITDIQEDGTLGMDIRAADIPNSDLDGYKLVEGDLLFARSGATVGKTFLYSQEYGECIYAGYLIRFQPDDRVVLPEYLFGFTRTGAYAAWVAAQAKAVAQPNINAKQYSSLPIPVPDLDLQRQFLKRVQQIKYLKGKHLHAERDHKHLEVSLQQLVFTTE